MKNILLIVILSGYCFSCKTKNSSKINVTKIVADTTMLDSMKKKADTFYSKRYPRTDLTAAEHYISYSDSTITQVMKDDGGTIRKIIIEKNKMRSYTASFYPNGQLMATYDFDQFGQYNDSSKEFFENGVLKTEGIYRGGLHSGKWKKYDSTGKYINTDEYDQNGQIIKTAE